MKRKRSRYNEDSDETDMTREERLKQIMEMEEFAFIKDIPSDKLWKLIFAINFIMGNENE